MPPQPAERAPTLNAVAAEAVVTSRGSAVVVVAGVAIGAAHPIRVIAGPCSVEGPGQFYETAIAVQAAGAVLLRGGAPSRGPRPMLSRGWDGRGSRSCAAWLMSSGWAS